MEFVRFKNDNNIYIVDFDVVSEHVISLTFSGVAIPESYLNGFEQLNKDNGIPEGSYEKYTTEYRKYAESPLLVELSDDNSIYVEPPKPLPVISFYSDFGGTLDGETTQSVSTYEELVIPTPVPNENYEFVEWVPEIPQSGAIEESKSFRATYKYVPPLSEVKANKKYELQNQSALETEKGIQYKENTFPYSASDKNEIRTKMETAIKLNTSVIVYMSNQIQMELTKEEVIELYRQEEANAIHHNVYLYQMFAYVDSLRSSASVSKVVYGHELTGKYLDAYNTAVEHEKTIVEKYIQSLINSGDTSSIAKLEKDVANLTTSVNTVQKDYDEIKNNMNSVNSVLFQSI
ncbi:MAG: hypothetical protein ACLTWK_12190 [Eisenbergiella sp.]